MIQIKSMDVEQLLNLRISINDELVKRRERLEAQLGSLDGEYGHGRRGGRSRLKGRKVPPKYKGPNGETWAGRGAMPRWLTALVGKSRRKMEVYRIK